MSEWVVCLATALVTSAAHIARGRLCREATPLDSYDLDSNPEVAVCSAELYPSCFPGFPYRWWDDTNDLIVSVWRGFSMVWWLECTMRCKRPGSGFESSSCLYMWEMQSVSFGRRSSLSLSLFLTHTHTHTHRDTTRNKNSSEHHLDDFSGFIWIRMSPLYIYIYIYIKQKTNKANHLKCLS